MHSNLIELILSYLPGDILVNINYNNNQFWQFMLKRDFRDESVKAEFKYYYSKSIKIINLIPKLLSYIKRRLNDFKYGLSLDQFGSNFIQSDMLIPYSAFDLPGKNCLFIISLNDQVKEHVYCSNNSQWTAQLTLAILRLTRDTNRLYLNGSKHTIFNTYRIDFALKP